MMMMAVLGVVERPCGVIEWPFRREVDSLMCEAVSSCRPTLDKPLTEPGLGSFSGNPILVRRPLGGLRWTPRLI